MSVTSHPVSVLPATASQGKPPGVRSMRFQACSRAFARALATRSSMRRVPARSRARRTVGPLGAAPRTGDRWASTAMSLMLMAPSAIATASEASTVPRSSSGDVPFFSKAADNPAVRPSWSAALRSRIAPAWPTSPCPSAVTFRARSHEAKLDVMEPHLARQAATGRSGVAAIGVAQEFQRVWTASEGKTSTGTPRWSFYKADRRVTCYYFYLWDQDFGPAFIKVCAWFPYPAKIWVNGQYAERQAERAGIGFTALSNGFAACEDPAALQAICDRLGPGTINVFVQQWLHRLPLPFGLKDHDAGYWWETSMRQVEVSRTIVFDAPRHARGFFEALVADNLDIGRPHNVEIIFARKIRRDTKGVFRTAIDRRDNGGVLVNVFYKHSRIKQYLNYLEP